MSKHRRHIRREEGRKDSPAGGLNNFDISSIAGLLNSVDINQLSGIINNVSRNLDASIEVNSINESENAEVNEVSRRKNEIVKSLQTIINADKAELLQVVLQLYAASRTVKK